MTPKRLDNLPPGTVMQIQPQQMGSDCTVAALATLIGIPYTVALTAVSQVNPRVMFDGAFFSQVKKAAGLLGVTLRKKRTIDWEEDTGLLRALCGDANAYHAVVLHRGSVIDDARLWPADVWKATRHASKFMLLIIVCHSYFGAG